MKRFIRRNIKYILTTLLLLVFFCGAVRGIHIRSVNEVRNEAQELAGITATVSPEPPGDGGDVDSGGGTGSDPSWEEPANGEPVAEQSADGADSSRQSGKASVGRQDSSQKNRKSSVGKQDSSQKNRKASEGKQDSSQKNRKASEGKQNSTGKDRKDSSGKAESSGKNRKTSVGKTGSAGQKQNASAKRKISDGSGKKPDQYHTDPVPSGRPEPVNEEDQSVNQKRSFYVSLSIDVITVLDHMGDLKPGLEKYVPEDGWILPKTRVLCYEGETAWDVMSRECKARGINVQSSYTALYHSVYMEGINQIGEFDCGKTSGWIYEVDGWIPNYSSSRYVMVEGEYLRWRYSCTGFGADLDGIRR